MFIKCISLTPASPSGGRVRRSQSCKPALHRMHRRSRIRCRAISEHLPGRQARRTGFPPAPSPACSGRRATVPYSTHTRHLGTVICALLSLSPLSSCFFLLANAENPDRNTHVTLLMDFPLVKTRSSLTLAGSTRCRVRGFLPVLVRFSLRDLHYHLFAALLGTLLPLPQVKKVYTTLAPSTTSQLLLPHIKQALDAAHESSTSSNSGNGHPHHNSNTSPFMRHKRSFTSASSLSTMSRCSGNGDNALSKFILLQPNSTDMKSIEAVKELKNDICKIYAGNETISKDLAETDFETLFPRFDVSFRFPYK